MATRRPTQTEFMNLVRHDADVGEQVFQYYFVRGEWGAMDEDDARLNFYRHVQANTPEIRAWAQAYLPHYAPTPPRWSFNIDSRVRDALIAGGATAGAGLVGLIFGDEIGNEAARNAVNNASQTALIMSPAASIIYYADHKSQRTARAIASTALLLGGSLFAYFTSLDMNSGMLKEGMQTVSKMAAGAAPVVGFVRYLKG